MVDISFKRSHFSLKPNSSGKNPPQLSDKDTALHSSHQDLITLEWQASGAFLCDELSLFFIFFPLWVSALLSQSAVPLAKPWARKEVGSQTKLTKGLFCNWGALGRCLNHTHFQWLPAWAFSSHYWADKKTHCLLETNMAICLHALFFQFFVRLKFS